MRIIIPADIIWDMKEGSGPDKKTVIDAADRFRRGPQKGKSAEKIIKPGKLKGSDSPAKVFGYVGPVIPEEAGIQGDEGLERVYRNLRVLKGEVPISRMTVGDKSREQLIAEMYSDTPTFGASQDAIDLMSGSDFKVSPASTIDVVKLRVEQLGLPDQAPNYEVIYDRAKELGLSLCPPEMGPRYLLQSRGRDSKDETVHIAMQPIRRAQKENAIFSVQSRGETTVLSYAPFAPYRRVSGKAKFIFKVGE